LPNALEDSLIEEEEWFTVVGAVVHGHGFALYAGANRDVSITLSPERPTLEIRFAVQVCPPVSERGGEEVLARSLLEAQGYKGL